MIEIDETTYRLKMARIAGQIAGAIYVSGFATEEEVARRSARMAGLIMDFCDIFIEGTLKPEPSDETKAG